MNTALLFRIYFGERSRGGRDNPKNKELHRHMEGQIRQINHLCIYKADSERSPFYAKAPICLYA